MPNHGFNRGELNTAGSSTSRAAISWSNAYINWLNTEQVQPVRRSSPPPTPASSPEVTAALVEASRSFIDRMVSGDQEVGSHSHTIRRSQPSYQLPEDAEEADDVDYAMAGGSFGLMPGGAVSGNVQQGSQDMTTVAQIFGQRATYPSLELHPLIVGRNLAGIEIELENIRGSRRFNYWTQKGDGSLRNNGAEFVCSNPWGGVDLYNAAIEIDGFLFENNPDASWRCSTHVHIDVRDMSVAQVKKMILAYAFYERVLFKCSGFQRYKNNFCVALGFAQEQVNVLGQHWNKDDTDFLVNVTQNWDKYSSINLLPMAGFGSIEFRISEAKWRKGKLIRLVNRFLSLKEVAMANDEMNDRQFIEMLYATPIKHIIQKGLPKGLDGLEEDLDFGYKLANDIVSMNIIRRKSIKEFLPDVNDGSRVLTNCQINNDGWNHCRHILTRRYADKYEYPTRLPTTLTFNFLYELRKMVKRHTSAWDIEWFLPATNRNQYARLWSEYYEGRRREEIAAQEAAILAQPVAAPTPTRRRRQNGAPVQVQPQENLQDWLEADSGDTAF